jgi:hypothetical protein
MYDSNQNGVHKEIGVFETSIHRMSQRVAVQVPYLVVPVRSMYVTMLIRKAFERMKKILIPIPPKYVVLLWCSVAQSMFTSYMEERM